MQQFAIIFLSILLEALPFVLIGTIVSSLIEIFVSREWLTEHLPKKSWFAFLVAGLAGIVFPICECAIVPVMRRLIKKGMPLGVAVTFMLATPTINPVVLLSTRFAFLNNFYFPLLRGVFGYLTAVAVGLLITFLSDKEELKTAEKAWAGDGEHDHEELCACGHSHKTEQAEHGGEWGHTHAHDYEELCTCGHSHKTEQVEHSGERAHADAHEHEHTHTHDHDERCACGHSHKTEQAEHGGEWEHTHAHDHDHEELCTCGHSHKTEQVEHSGEREHADAHEHEHTHTHDHDERCACGHSHEHNDDDELCTCGHVHATKRDKPLQIMKSVLEHTSHELYEVGRFLILGVLISAAMQTFVPKQYFLALSQNPALSIVAMMLLAFVLSLCSEADAFVAASFQGGLPNSAILAFLLFGPMMDIKNMLMLAQGFRMKFIIRLILLIAVVVFVFSSISAFLF